MPSGGPVERVEFLIDGVRRWTERHEPYVFNGNEGVWDSRRVANGFHRLTVRALAADGRVARATLEVRVVNGTVRAFSFPAQPRLIGEKRVRVKVKARRGSLIVSKIKDREGRVLAKVRREGRRKTTSARLRLHGWKGDRPLRVLTTVRSAKRVRRMTSRIRMPAALFMTRPELRPRRRLTIRASAVPGSVVETVVQSRGGRVLGNSWTLAGRSGLVRRQVALPLWSGQRRLRVVLRTEFGVGGAAVVRRTVKLTREELKGQPRRKADPAPAPAPTEPSEPTKPSEPTEPSPSPTPSEPSPSEPSPSQPSPSDPVPVLSGSATAYAIGSTQCERPVPLVGSYFRYTAAPGERTAGEHGERCEHFYGNKELTAEGKRSTFAFAVWLPADFKYVGGDSDWFYVFQAHKNCPCGGWGGPNVGLSINSDGNFKIKIRALDAKEVYAKTLGPATRGTRHTFLINAYWSQTGAGDLAVDWNGSRVVAYSGPTLFNDDSGGVKIQGGVYRRSTSYEQTVYLARTHYGPADGLRSWLASLPASPVG